MADARIAHQVVVDQASEVGGRYQFLDSTWAGVGGAKTANPQLQDLYGMRYIRGRYGTPSAAWDFWQRQQPHWYDQGGWLQPGATMAINNTGKPEAVIPIPSAGTHAG